ncbi:UNVERIFIED_CONTAM: putative ribonuclease H protein [Sesamum calycinum]|uniref:Ribonuclease H protein n=1 Tax=Sesamum calycinum TaxID=2727403 RepID=A0AAW2KWX0_9LAMI
MEDGEDGELGDGSHGAVLAAPATAPTAGGGAMMMDETEQGELENDNHGAGSASPTTPKTAKGNSTMEKLKAEFNINEFFELALRVIDDGDLESMEVLKKLKNKWIKKLGGDFALAGHGRFRPADDQAALFCAAPTSTSEKDALSLIDAAPVHGTSRDEAPHVIMAPRASDKMKAAAALERPMEAAALTEDAAAHGTSRDKAPQAIIVPRAASGPLAAAALMSPLAAAACASTEAPSHNVKPPRLLELQSTPPPLTATTVEAMDGLLSPWLPAPPRVETSPPSVSEAPTLKPSQPAMDDLLALNGLLHHRKLTDLSPPASLIQTAMVQNPSPSRDRTAPPQQINATASLPAATVRQQPPPAVFPTTTASPANSLPELFIGNIPLHPHSAFKVNGDKIADAFHNSSRKTLNFIPPSVQNGEVIVRPSIDAIRAGSKRWNTTAVGYFLGKKPYFHHLNEFVRSIWPGVRDVKATSNGFFFFQFETVAAMEEVIEGGPWLYLGQPIVLQKWEPGMVLRKLKHTEVPVWIKLRHLPVELWTTEGLSTVASGIGRPLYPDAITRACTRLDFARVCVMLNVSSKLPKHVVIMMPNELGGESACKVDVEYEWLPPKCKKCVSLGHSTATCPESNKIEKPKGGVCTEAAGAAPPTVSKTMAKESVRTVQHTVPEEAGTVDMEIGTDERSYIDKGKRILERSRTEQARPSGGSEGACKRIQVKLLGLLETRVSAVNVLRVQTFCHDGLGSLIMICLNLVTLADSISDEPWIVGGDFNTVVDMSEVCGASADIHLAMNEFRDLKEIVAYGNVWIDCWLMMLGYDCGQIRIINVLTLGLPITPHLCSEEILIIIRIEGTSMYAVTRKLRALKPVFRTLRKKKGDLSVNVKLAAEFLATVQQLLQIDRHNTLLLCLEKCCKLVFFKATKLEQVMLQQRAKIQWLKGGDQCSRIFFRKVAMRRASKRVFQIINEDGHTLTTQEDVVNEFVSFYQRLLGGGESGASSIGYTGGIKDAFFDIAEDKAPGPDGYSSGFYKAAWPVIGEEMIKAILEFFTTGRLLKQRLRIVLDKLISPSQNAFVPGRSIGDNILLAQELFAGYNRQGLPMRCALKVDLRKAYDTVEWDFLSAVLQMFGFPGTFIGWVEECVTTPMFSVCNGNLTVSSRVPGDDLLLFCKADVASVRVFRHGLAEFAKLSGLHANPQKSQLILSRSAQDVREQLLAALHFQEGHLPLRMGKHSVVLCGENSINQIGAHVTKCLLGNGLHITERGHQRGGKKDAYLLVERNSAVGYPKVAWNVVCKPIEEGGQGIRDILALNKALMSRHLWNVIQNNQSSIWVKWIAHTRLRHKSVWTVDVKGGSWGWRKILRLRSALLPYIEFKIGDGESFSLWHDPWHSLGSLITRFPRGPGRTNIPEAAKLSAVLVDGDWSWPPITDLECIEILHVLPIFTMAATLFYGEVAVFLQRLSMIFSVIMDLR